MFGIINYGGFLVSSILLNITPGADTIYILNKAATGGRKKGIASALGISTGILVHTFLAAAGLSIILAKSAFAFNAIKILGAVYLINMGIRALISKENLIKSSEEKNQTIFHTYKQGVITNVLNPKVALFFLALLPQFIDENNSYGAIPFLILGITFFATSTVWNVIIACIASLIYKLITKNEKVASISNKVSGLIYVGLGVNLLGSRVS